MPIAFAVTLAALAATQPGCPADHPGTTTSAVAPATTQRCADARPWQLKHRTTDGLTGAELGLLDAAHQAQDEPDQDTLNKKRAEVWNILDLLGAAAQANSDEQADLFDGPFPGHAGDDGDHARATALATPPTPVPEPASWSMLLAGLTLLGRLHARGRCGKRT